MEVLQEMDNNVRLDQDYISVNDLLMPYVMEVVLHGCDVHVCVLQGSRRYYEMEVHHQRAAQERQLRRGANQVGVSPPSAPSAPLSMSAQCVIL